ncbi:bifunctional 2-polyprenyl-6-hydroxyphenol methylase/3-demethylubiquinol 3-O-methyltransferase UbiG [Magnetofaba australis]|uniref:Ubiquinone biosynthesis O-methyltransferase n=1 Tax=Magnetofaba australis IT-1 TaxID=1434232 RepID=A0A1Y2K7W6_9PROT|nr:bifunctional 2-polyprenyl-6-hydroxyphenol methylase/3-demethylubiquinol 3-O-methyltransferase UbiG [Magnetofaba australis]OSM04875.1 putative 3-demethylubiquinone-9 3-methyltransferase [Magnetofaba australis IT-1]
MSDVDQQEIAKFESMAHEWWDPSGKFKLLHQINPLRAGYARRVLRGDEYASLEGLKIVDIGCGGGILSEELHDAGAEVTGLDRSEKIIGVARAHQADSGSSVDYRVQSAQDLAVHAPESYDVVMAMEVLEHVPDVTDFLSACVTLLKPGGTLFFATLNRTPKAWALAIFGAENILRWLPRGTHEFDKFIKPSELSESLRALRTPVRDVCGMRYAMLRDDWELCADTSVNYLGYAVKAQAE